MATLTNREPLFEMQSMLRVAFTKLSKNIDNPDAETLLDDCINLLQLNASYFKEQLRNENFNAIIASAHHATMTLAPCERVRRVMVIFSRLSCFT